MIWLTIASAIPGLALVLWLLIEARSHRHWALIIATPLALASPIALYIGGSGLLGYAVDARFPETFDLLHAEIDDAREAIYVLVRALGGEPRLYVITKDYDANRKAIGDAQAKQERGIAQRGEMISDKLVFYVLPPMEHNEKDKP
jgi:hypothetical protein